MKRLRWIRLMAPALILAASVAACDVGQVTFNESRGSQLPQDALTVHVVPAPADTGLAEQLGWEKGVPGAKVTVIDASESPADSSVARTGPTGHTTFTGLDPNRTYKVAAYRKLKDAEVQSVRTQEPAVRAFGGGDKDRPGDTLELPVEHNRTDGLVISELAYISPLVEYDFFGYVEVYNNSASTIFLDGKIIGPTTTYARNYSNFPCQIMQPFFITDEGIWARFFQRFPGDGKEYPLPPGEAAVIATDAIDHTTVSPKFLDLTDADFEFTGPAEADNPAVPDMEIAGLRPWFLGHGLSLHAFVLGNEAAFLAEGVEIQSLRRDRPPRIERPQVLFPAEKLLDVTGSLSPGGDFCAEQVHDRFDRLAKTLEPAHQWRLSYQRRAVGSVDGRTILLDTNTSEVDFTLLERSPDRPPPIER